MFDSSYYRKKRNLEQKPTKEQYKQWKRDIIFYIGYGATITLILCALIVPNIDLIFK